MEITHHTHKGVELTIEDHKTRHLELRKSFEEGMSLFFSEEQKYYSSTPIIDVAKFFGVVAKKIDEGEKVEANVDIKQLHANIDELIADWLYHQEDRSSLVLSRTSAMDLLKWAISQENIPTNILVRDENFKPKTDEEVKAEAVETAMPNKAKSKVKIN